jgi:aspartate aminotransferase
MPHLTPNVARLPSSGIREILDLVFASPGDLIRLEIGEPDFATPAHIVEAAFEATRRGSSYLPSAGMPALREALRDRVARDYGSSAGVEQVLVSQGAVQAINAVMSAVVGPGDEVLVPDPAWPNYEMQATMLGASAVHYSLHPATGFQPDPAEIARLITPRTRAIVLNSPNNPTGAVLPPETVRQIVELAVRHDLLVISDEVYDEIIFDGSPANAAQYAPEHVASVYSFSKTYAMTGWRVGYAVLPTWLAGAVSRVFETGISCVSSVTQSAALAAITGPQQAVAEMRNAYRGRRDVAVDLLRGAGIEVAAPSGAFYLMIPLDPAADARRSALDLVGRGVALSPGTAFGSTANHHLRVSLATSEDGIRLGMTRFIDWYRDLDGGLALGPRSEAPASAR